jgi:hypothetical protein
VLLSDDANDYNSLDDGTESDGDHVERRGGSESAGDAMLDDV